jgi:hypothetical protein
MEGAGFGNESPVSQESRQHPQAGDEGGHPRVPQAGPGNDDDVRGADCSRVGQDADDLEGVAGGEGGHREDSRS